MTSAPYLPDREVGTEIPRILHQVWVGSEPPAWARENWALWDELLLPLGWETRRYTEENADEWRLTAYMRKTGSLPTDVVAADFIRIEQVWKHGGVYADSDTVPLKSIEDLVGAHRGWLTRAGWDWRELPEGEDPKLNNHLFGFPQHHPVPQALWRAGIDRLDNKNPMHILGPVVLDKTYRRFAGQVDLMDWRTFPDLPRKMIRNRELPQQEQLREHFPTARAVHMANKSWYGSNHSVYNTPTFIMAVPWQDKRADRARELQDETRGKVVWDSNHNAFDTWRRLLREIGTGPAIVLEDDVVLAKDWRNRVEEVIKDHKADVIQFFSMRGADLTVGSRYEPGRTYLMNQCHYLPEGAAKELLRFTENWVAENPEHATGMDTALSAWLKATKRRYWLQVPSLVQHEKWRSEINPKRSSARQSSTFEAAF